LLAESSAKAAETARGHFAGANIVEDHLHASALAAHRSQVTAFYNLLFEERLHGLQRFVRSFPLREDALQRNDGYVLIAAANQMRHQEQIVADCPASVETRLTRLDGLVEFPFMGQEVGILLQPNRDVADA